MYITKDIFLRELSEELINNLKLFNDYKQILEQKNNSFD